MRAILPTRTGGPDVLVLAEHPTPSPGPGQALVRVEAAGVNFIDIYQRSGQYPVPIPIQLGREGSGVVEAVGSGVALVKPGDRVAWADGGGAYATHVAVRAEALVPLPEGVDAKTAAASM